LDDTTCNRQGAGERVSALHPVVQWLPKYTSTALSNDVIVGLTLAIIVIPQGLAYAALAGLRPVTGLYTAMIPSLVYTIFGTSKHMSFGPFGLTSILVLDGLESQGFDGKACGSDPTGKDCAEYESAAIGMSFLVGLIHIAMLLLRLDSLSTLLADSVMTGFTTAAAFIIGSSQLHTIVGFNTDQSSLYTTWFGENGWLQNLDKTSWQAILCTVIAVAILMGLQDIDRL